VVAVGSTGSCSEPLFSIKAVISAFIPALLHAASAVEPFCSARVNKRSEQLSI
jgi:hypothetical protein